MAICIYNKYNIYKLNSYESCRYEKECIKLNGNIAVSAGHSIGGYEGYEVDSEGNCTNSGNFITITYSGESVPEGRVYNCGGKGYDVSYFQSATDVNNQIIVSSRTDSYEYKQKCEISESKGDFIETVYLKASENYPTNGSKNGKWYTISEQGFYKYDKYTFRTDNFYKIKNTIITLSDTIHNPPDSINAYSNCNFNIESGKYELSDNKNISDIGYISVSDNILISAQYIYCNCPVQSIKHKVLQYYIHTSTIDQENTTNKIKFIESIFIKPPSNLPDDGIKDQYWWVLETDKVEIKPEPDSINSLMVIDKEINAICADTSIFFQIYNNKQDNITTNIKIDNVVKHTITNTNKNELYSFTLHANDYKILDAHTITLEAITENDKSTKTFIFKRVDKILKVISSIKTTDNIESSIFFNLQAVSSSTDIIQILATNNAFDKEPIWEDISNYINKEYKFKNKEFINKKHGTQIKIIIIKK